MASKPTLKQVRAGIIYLVAGAFALRFIIWAIDPFLPYLVGAAMVITVVGILIYRTTKI